MISLNLGGVHHGLVDLGDHPVKGGDDPGGGLGGFDHDDLLALGDLGPDLGKFDVDDVT